MTKKKKLNTLANKTSSSVFKDTNYKGLIRMSSRHLKLIKQYKWGKVMTETQLEITKAFHLGKITFNFWNWAIKQLDKVVDFYDETLYDEVIIKFNNEVKNENSNQGR